MGGESKTQQTQNSTTNPWEPAVPALNGILGQLNTQLGNTGVTANENNALNTLTSNAQQASQFAPQITGFAQNLLNGGGANGQAGNVQGGYDTFKGQMEQFADPNYSSMNNPALRAALQQVQDDVGSSVNGQFAAAGRDLSGANQMAYGRGVSAAQAPLILNQFNQDRATQQGAANALYTGQNTTSGILSGMNQQGLSNQAQGITAAGAATDAQNAGANATLAAEAARRGIPVQALGLLAQIGIPIAGLGGQSTGKSEGTNQMSGAQQFATIASGTGNLFKSFFPGGL